MCNVEGSSMVPSVTSVHVTSEIYGVSVFIGAIDMVRVGHPEIQGQAWVKRTAWLKVCDNCGHARTQILAVRVDG
jgi:hypothetical protein